MTRRLACPICAKGYCKEHEEPRPPEEKVCPQCFKQHANKTKYCYLHEPPEGKHSPLPWKLCGNRKCTCKMIWSVTSDSHIATALDEGVACVHGEWGDGKDMIYGENLNVAANAEFIVKAVNLHAKLVEALEEEHNIKKPRLGGWHEKKCEICALLKEAKK